MQSLTNSFNQSTSVEPQIAQKEPLLVIEDVSKVYPTAKAPYTVVEGINLTVYEGEFVCVIGHSGCGKSTLLNMVAGFSKPTQGEVRLRGNRITKPGPDRMMVFQNYSLLPWKTAFENVYLGVNRAYAEKSKAEKVAIVEEHLAMVGLLEAANKKPPQLSGGMKQRVAIARALAIRPEVLILDEPFGALDAITKEELQEELLQIWRDHRVTVLMITHDIDEALFLADRVVMMTNGPAAQIGEVLEIPFKRPRVRSQVVEDPRYYELRNHALDFLFCRFAHSEEELVSTALTAVVEPRTAVQTKVETETVMTTPASVKTSVNSALPITEPLTMTYKETPVTTSASKATRMASAMTLSAFSVLLLGAWMIQLPKETQKTEMPVQEVVADPMPTTPAQTTTPSVEEAPINATTASPEAPVDKITDPQQLEKLQLNLYDQIDRSWQTTPTFTEDLVYQVKVNSSGEIISYETANQAASEYLKETPFANINTSAGEPAASLAEFKVVLSPVGSLNVTPE